MTSAAFIVGTRGGPGAILQDIARGIGFSPVERFTDVERAEVQVRRTPLVFFMFAAVSDVTVLKPIAEAIRASTVPAIHFSPMIYFAHDLSLETISHCVQLGFDDVVALPMASAALRARLARQVNRPHVYFETPNYFGPDRRNRFDGPARSGNSDRGGGTFRRIEIVRNATAGVGVLREERNEVLI